MLPARAHRERRKEKTRLEDGEEGRKQNKTETRKLCGHWELKRVWVGSVSGIFVLNYHITLTFHQYLPFTQRFWTQTGWVFLGFH